MSNYTLLDLLKKGVQPGFAIYAYGTGEESKARYGQTQFENGGILDGTDKIIDSEQYWRAHSAFTEGDAFTDDDSPESVRFEDVADEFLEWLVEEDWIEYHNPECYADDPGCPACGGVIFGADFPNGGSGGGCLVCHRDWVWDNESAEWNPAW
jgi:hypothetical protein